MKSDTRILFIEDDPKDVELVMSQLKMAQLDPHVKVITDGRAAVRYLTDEKTECESLVIVFLDLKLPFVSGIQVLETIRADDRLQHLPVMVMTSSNNPADLEKCLELGVTHFLPKPITFSVFAKAVADCIHNRPAESTIEMSSGTDD